MVVITDGGDTMSSENKESLARRRRSDYYSIIIVPIEADAGRHGRRTCADVRFSSIRAANITTPSRWRNWTKPFSENCDELRTQYLLAYYRRHISEFKFEFRQLTWS